MDPKLPDPLEGLVKRERLHQAGTHKRLSLAEQSAIDFEIGQRQLESAAARAALIQEARQAEQQQALAEAPRTAEQLTGDALLGMGQFVSSIGTGAAGIATSLVGQDEATQKVMETASEWDQALRNRRSRISQLNEEAVARENQAASAENARLRAESDNPESFGQAAFEQARNFRDVAGNIISNPTRMFDLVTSQLPSLGAGLGARGVVSAGSALLRKELTEEARQRALTGALAANVGAMEGSGAFGEAYRGVLEAPIEDLIRQYPDRAEALRTNPEQARRDLAESVALPAAGMQAVAAGLTSRLAADFELNPLGSTTAGRAAGTAGARLRGNVSNVARETAEETIQSSTGALAGNAAEMLAGNVETSLLDDTGASAAEGTVGGLGMAGAMQAPSIAANTVALPISAVINRANKIKEEIKAEEKKGRQAEVAAVASMAADASITSQEVPEEVRYTAPVEDPILTPERNEELKTASADRLQSLAQVLTALEDTEGADPATVQSSSLYAIKTARTLRNHVAQVVDPAIEAATDDATRQNLMRYRNQINRLANSDVIQGLESRVAEVPAEALDNIFNQLPDVVDLGTDVSPEILQAVETVKEIAYTAPEKLSSQLAARVLMHAPKAGVSEADTKQLSLALDVATVRESYDQTLSQIRERTPRFKPTSIVSKEIRETGFTLGKNKLKSINQYVRDISQAVSEGDFTFAQEDMRTFARFAQHMAAKAMEIDRVAMEAFEAGSPDKRFNTTLTTYDESGKKTTTPLWVNLGFEQGVGLVDGVFADANAVVQTYNALVNTYPELLRENMPPRLSLPTEPRYRSAQATPASSANNTSERTPDVAEQPAADVPAAATPEPVPTEDGATGTETTVPVGEEAVPAQAQEATPQQDQAVPEQAPSTGRKSDLTTWSDDALATEEARAEARHAENPSRSNYRALQIIRREWDRRDAINAPKPKTLKERFKTLREKSSNGDSLEAQNLFLKAFKLRENPSSLFAKLSNPLLEIKDAIKSDRLSEYMGPLDRGFQWGDQDKRSLTEIVDQVVPYLVRQLNQNLRASKHTPENDGWKYANRMSLYLTNWGKDSSGKDWIQYDQTIAEGISLAATQWALEMVNQPVKPNWDDIHKLFPAGLSSEMVNAYRTSHFYEQPVRNLANKIVQTLGLQADNNTPTNWSEGIANAMALDALYAMDAAGILNVNKVIVPKELTDQETSPSLYFIEFNKDESPVDWNKNTGKKSLQPLRNNINMMKFTRLMDSEAIQYGSFEPVKVTQQRQNGTNNNLTSAAKKALAKANKQPFFKNEIFSNFLNKLDPSDLLKIRGYDFNSDNYNVQHRTSVRGANLGLWSAQQLYTELESLWENVAREQGNAIGDTPIYFPHVIDSNDRLRQEGNLTPQNNKFARELIVPFKVTLDLQNNNDHLLLFSVSLAQAWGIKTEKSKREDYIHQLSDMLDIPPVMEVVDLIHRLEAGEDVAAQVATGIENLMASKLMPRTDRALHALHTYARHVKALADGTDNEFVTSLPIEMDGKTDGPINAMIHMALHNADETLIHQLAQGGLFINDLTYKTLNEAGSDLGDIYLNVSTRFQETTREKVDNARGPLKNLWGAAINLLALADQVSLPNPDDLSTVTAKRDIAKEAVTPKGYGAGDASVVAKLVQKQMDAVYEAMSDALQNDDILSPSMIRDIALLSGVPEQKLRDRKNYQNFQFTTEQIKKMRQNVKKTVGSALNAAVNTEMEKVQETFQLLYKVSALQAAMLRHQYNKAYDTLRDQRIEEGKLRPTDALSRADERKILNDLAKFAPTIATKHSNPEDFLSGITAVITERGVQMRNGRSVRVQGINGGVGMDTRITEVDYPGVRIAALYNIGIGDAAMIIDFINETDEGMLPVYDGIEVSPLDLTSLSQRVNRIVHDNWKFNALGAVKDSFERMEFDFSGFSQQEWTRLGKALHLPPNADVQSTVKEEIKTLKEVLPAIAERSARAKKVIFEETPTSTDHMATGEAPHVTDHAPNPDFLRKIHGIEATPAARPISATELKAQLSRKPFKDKVTGNIYKMLEPLIPDDMVAFVGSREAVTAAFLERHPDQSVNPNANGWAFGNAVYIVNRTGETVVHELVHATTYNLIRNYYNGQTKGLSAHQKAAIQNLEILTREFSDNMDFAEGSDAAHVQSVVSNLLSQNDLPAAINELMAYTLSSPGVQAELKTRQPTSLIGKMSARVVDAVRRLLGIPKNQYTESFLTQVLGESFRLMRRPAGTTMGIDRVLNQLDNSPIRRDLERIWQAVPTMGKTPEERGAAALRALNEARTVTDEFKAAGFDFTPEQESIFSQTQAILLTGFQLDPTTMTALSKLHAEAMKELSSNDFLDDPTVHSVQDDAQAMSRYEALAMGGKDQLANFLALALTWEPLRTKLASLVPPKAQKTQPKNMDERLRDGATKLFDKVFDASLGMKPTMNQQQAIEHLVARLADAQERTVAAQKAANSNLLAQAEARVRKAAEGLDERIGKKQEAFNATTVGGKIADMGMTALRAALTDTGAEAMGNATLSMTNEMRGFKPLRELIQEVVGTTSQNWEIHKLLNQTKEMVSTARQRLREEAPAEIRKLFKNGLTDSQSKVLHRGIGQADLQALGRSVSLSTLSQYLGDPKALEAAVAQAEAEIDGTVYRDRYLAATKDLAEFMMLGKASGHGRLLYTNASAISMLVGDANLSGQVGRKYVDKIDRLTTLRALTFLTESERQAFKELVDSEPEGVQSLINLSRTMVRRDMQKLTDSRHLFNYQKGFIPSSKDPRHSVMMAPASRAAELKKLGYKAVGLVNPDSAEPAGAMMYFAMEGHGGQATYNQGAMQTVEASANGIHLATGMLTGGMVSTYIGNPKTVRAITDQKLMSPGAHGLRPVFNDKAEVVGYQRIMDPDILAKHTRGKEDVAQAFGMWLGRQQEELVAKEFNHEVVKVLKRYWDKPGEFSKDEFVDISKPSNKVEEDIWNSIPSETRDLMKEVFDGPVMVRKDVLNNALGYRTPSVADVFTGTSELPEKVRSAVESAAFGLLGKDAYKYLVHAERAVQGAVQLAKNAIIVRSGVVVMANTIANQLQLLAHGVPVTKLAQIQARKVQETETYLRNSKKAAQLRLQLAHQTTAQGRLAKERQIEQLDAMNRRLSIWPLLEQGELPSIVEGLSENDEYTILSDFTGWLEKKNAALPEGLSRAAKYAVIAEDTAIYQGLNRAIQFGDFVAKAAVYDQLIAEGMSKEDALRDVSETFVNYNLLPGRTRTYLEQIGLTWFMNYKIRMQKIVLRAIRRNPLRFLMAVSGGAAIGADTLLDTAGPNANWSAGVGYGQLLDAPTVSLWYQLAGY